MRIIIVAAALIAVAGCASESAKLSAADLAQIDTDALCKMSLKSKINGGVAEMELNRRNATCDWKKLHLVKVIQERDNSTADQTAAAFQQMASGGMPQQPVQPINPSVCTTAYSNNQSHTICQ